MPLIHGKSDESRSKNIAELIRSGRDPKQAAAIAYSEQRKSKDADEPYDFTIDKNKNFNSARKHDLNDYLEVPKNPISKVGVFPYSGAQIGMPELEPDKIYMVYRPEQELSKPQTIESFKLLPFTDEHAMLGSEDGLMAPEDKGVHGITGEDVFFESPYLKANIKVFSNTLKDLINEGKRELSIGYRCLYEYNPGRYNGQDYDFIQREIRGNHLALVDEGRSGSDVAVLDSFKFVMDTKELKMPDYEKPDMMETGEAADEMSLEECGKMIKELAAKVEKMMGAEKAEAEHMMDEEENEATKELSEKAALEGDAKDEEAPQEKFIHKFEVEDNDEDPSEMEAKTKENELKGTKDEDESKEEGDYTKSKGEGMDSHIKAIMKNIARRDDLANRLSNHIGVFDHSEKTLAEVAKYGVKKLGLKCIPGHEQSVLDGYLAAAKVSRIAMTHDSAYESKSINAYLQGVK